LGGIDHLFDFRLKESAADGRAAVINNKRTHAQGTGHNSEGMVGRPTAYQVADDELA